MKIKYTKRYTYLDEQVKISEDGKVLFTDNRLIMMDWETPMMEEHAKIVCHNKGDVLNIGFGMGIVDKFIQSHNPKSHHIIEIHPAIQNEMIKTGWHEKENVKLYFGDFKEFYDDIPLMDGIFFDTLIDSDFLEFTSIAWRFLKPGGVFTIFNNPNPSGNGDPMKIFSDDLKSVILDYYDVEIKIIHLPTVDEDLQDKYSHYTGYWSPNVKKYYCPILRPKKKYQINK